MNFTIILSFILIWFIQIEAVENILEELKCMDKPMFLVLNKCDVATQDQIDKIRKAYSNYKTVEISAFKNINIDKLLELESTLYDYKQYEYKSKYLEELRKNVNTLLDIINKESI